MTEALYLVYMMSLTFGLVYSFFGENIGLGKIVIFIMSLHMFSFQVFCLIQYSHTHTHTLYDYMITFIHKYSGFST